MKTYEKPMIIKVEDVAESVYMASGTAGGGPAGNDIEYTVSPETLGNMYYKHNVYKIKISNKSANDSLDWKVVLTVASGKAVNVSVYESRVKIALDGNKIVIQAGDGGNIQAGGNIEFNFDVEYESDIVVI